MFKRTLQGAISGEINVIRNLGLIIDRHLSLL
jgi:hypothetical protein